MPIPSEPGPPEPPDEPLQIEGPEEPEAEDTSYLQLPEQEEEVTEARKSEANETLDQLKLPNYGDVEKRLAEPEMNPTKQRNYLKFVIKNAETRRKQVVAMKSNATKDFKAGKITEEVRDLEHKKSDKFQIEIKDYINTINQNLKQ